VPIPKPAAAERIAADPRSTPSFANAVLYDLVSAVSMLTLVAPHDSLPKLCNAVRVPGGVYVFGQSSMVSGVRPFASAAAATITLNVEPGG
jgi:hypothetical protein